jgi:small multidrug resistance family-3 protein
MHFRQLNMTLLLLVIAAVLEAGGDAVIRLGLHASEKTTRIVLFALGGLILLSYGYLVNAAPWEFGRLLGVYVVFFFVVAQLTSWIVFYQPPTAAVLIGGSFILVGGAIISWNP